MNKLRKRTDKQAEKPTLLVVEDDADMLRLISLELQGRYQVLTAANGRDGLEQVMDAMPDLVITDLMMPVMDGIELCRKLKHNTQTSHIPVIMLTAKTAVDSQIEGLGVGADDYVTKPFNMLLLTTRIENLLRTRRLLREQFGRRAPWVAVPEQVLAGLEPVVDEGFNDRLDRGFWAAVTHVLEKNYQSPEFSIELLAAELDMSERSLQRKIKAITDLTPVQLIGKFRLKKAEELLRKPSNQVPDIAFQVGFGDLSHFYRLFKKEFGMSPSRYRDENL